MRAAARNIVLHWLPPAIAHQINLAKNVRFVPLEKEMRFVHLAKAGGDAIDVGANLGLYCEILAGLFNRVTAIEPQPRLVGYLRKVVPGNVTVVEGVASDGEGMTQLYVPRMRSGSDEIWRSDALASVESRAVQSEFTDRLDVRRFTLDSLKYDRKIDFIKIDVEGHERAVLDGAIGLLERDKPVLMVEIERAFNPDAEKVFQFFETKGYCAFNLADDKFVRTKIEVLDRASHPVHNYFFVHGSDPRLPRFT